MQKFSFVSSGIHPLSLNQYGSGSEGKVSWGLMMAVEGASVRHILLSHITFPQGNPLNIFSQRFFLLRFIFADLSSIG